jgi:pimeloyl-ACP methyl ester carboxylesterase
MRTDQWLPKVTMPVLIMHGARDSVIGIEHAERLAALKPEAQFVRLKDVAHNDVQMAREYLDKLAERLGQI